jgi:hypothetical protein
VYDYVVNIDCSANIDKLLEVPNDNKIYFVKLPYENKNNQEIIKTEIILINVNLKWNFDYT